MLVQIPEEAEQGKSPSLKNEATRCIEVPFSTQNLAALAPLLDSIDISGKLQDPFGDLPDSKDQKQGGETNSVVEKSALLAEVLFPASRTLQEDQAVKTMQELPCPKPSRRSSLSAEQLGKLSKGREKSELDVPKLEQKSHSQSRDQPRPPASPELKNPFALNDSECSPRNLSRITFAQTLILSTSHNDLVPIDIEACSAKIEPSPLLMVNDSRFSFRPHETQQLPPILLFSQCMNSINSRN